MGRIKGDSERKDGLALLQKLVSVGTKSRKSDWAQMAITFPSAQSTISFTGRLALYMLVVFHHIGKPRKRTKSQKDRIIKERLRISTGFSGGGCFRMVVLIVARGIAREISGERPSSLCRTSTWSFSGSLPDMASSCNSCFLCASAVARQHCFRSRSRSRLRLYLLWACARSVLYTNTYAHTHSLSLSLSVSCRVDIRMVVVVGVVVGVAVLVNCRYVRI